MNVKTLLTRAEYDHLLKTGHLEIDDPERGHIRFSMPPQEDHTGVVGRTGVIHVLRKGSAVTRDQED